MSAKEFQKLIDQQQIEFQAMRESYQADIAEARAQTEEVCQQLEQSLNAGAPPAAAAAAAPFLPGPPEVNSVAIRLPTFWTAAPELWFIQTEASFDTRHRKITAEASKYSHILQPLPQDVLMDCEEAISAEGPNRYTTLKAALIKAYGKTAATKSAFQGKLQATVSLKLGLHGVNGSRRVN